MSHAMVCVGRDAYTVLRQAEEQTCLGGWLTKKHKPYKVVGYRSSPKVGRFGGGIL